jgi:hypothetical protein
MDARSTSAILHPRSSLRPVYAFSTNIYHSCANILLQTSARKKAALRDVLNVRISSFTHYINHSSPLLQSDATRPAAGRRRPPISVTPLAPRAALIVEPQQSIFLRLSNFLRFSPSTNAARPGRKDQSSCDPLDVRFLCFLSHFTSHSRFSSLLRYPYLPIGSMERALHRLPYPVAAPLSIPLGLLQARESKRRVNQNENM